MKQKLYDIVRLGVILDAAYWPDGLRYGVTAVLVCLAIWIKWLLPLDEAPFLLFMPEMFVIGFLLGRGPGIAATMVTALAAEGIAVIRDKHIFSTLGQMLALALYIVISLLLVLICDLLREALVRRRADLLGTKETNQALLESRAALEASEAFLRSVLESSPDCIKVLDMEARLRFMNERGKISMEVSDFNKLEGCLWPDFWQGEANQVALSALADAREGKTARFQGYCPTVAGTPRWWDVVVSPILGSDGRPEKLLAISRDITEQKRSEAQQRLLNHELGHRLKNMLSMVQAIANQTLRRATTIDDARAAFDSRLIALGKAQDVLTGTQWESAELEGVVRNALAPHGAEADRFTIGGPILKLSSRCALALSLALHELATNATKYGALSVDAGRILVEWSVQADQGSARFTLRWVEMKGPPVIKPERTGFGSVLIERSLAGYFKGTARIDYAPAGVVFTLEGPVTTSDAIFATGEAEILAPSMNFNSQ